MIFNPTIKLKRASTISSELNVLKLIHMALALIVIAWMNSGFFTYVLPYFPNFIRYGLYFAWLGLAIVRNKNFVKQFIIQIWPLLLFYFYMFFISFFVETDLMVYIKSITYLIMVYSIFLYYFNGRFKSSPKVFCAFLIIDYIAVGINTYFQLQVNPLISRYLGTTPGIIEAMLGEGAFPGIGSYGYFYALVAMILLLGFMFFNNNKKRFISLFSIIAAIALLIKASYTMAIILAFIFLILIIILRYTKKHTATVIVILGLMSLLIFQGTFATMFGKIATIEKLPYEVSVRFDELSYFFSGKDISGTDLKSRGNLYYQSVEAFSKNIFGGTVLANNSMYKAGGHSAWLDLLASFGLFAIPFFMFLYKAYKYCKSGIPAEFQKFLNVYWLYFICLGFINTALFAPIYTIWFLFLPVFISTYLQEEKHQDRRWVIKI
jgi:ABC-type multidrug transport system fused ATPase/permease subunit